jgi:hypothetical protein
LINITFKEIAFGANINLYIPVFTAAKLISDTLSLVLKD